MKTVTLETDLQAPIDKVWAIFADVTRCDWVPGVDAISEKDGVRSFDMAGIGEIQEKIRLLDAQRHCLQYSAISTPSAIDHHLATIQLTAIDGERCRLHWSTEIEPDQFAAAIEQAMAAALAGLQQVLTSGR